MNKKNIEIIKGMLLQKQFSPNVRYRNLGGRFDNKRIKFVDSLITIRGHYQSYLSQVP